MRDPDFTLSAGPVTVSPRVLAALGSPIIYHYDPVFLERFRATERKLAQVFLTTNDVLLMQGEAVLGLEAAARGLVQPGTKVLNLVQGVFGKGMGYWLKDFGVELHELEVPYNDAVDPGEVERYLDDHAGIELVTVVHSETPSGTVCDLSAIGPIAHSHGALTLIDCVSSLGGIPLKTDEWHLDVCVAGAQKCLGGPPGMSLMTVSDAAWERIRANPTAPRASGARAGTPGGPRGLVASLRAVHLEMVDAVLSGDGLPRVAQLAAQATGAPVAILVPKGRR